MPVFGPPPYGFFGMHGSASAEVCGVSPAAVVFWEDGFAVEHPAVTTVVAAAAAVANPFNASRRLMFVSGFALVIGSLFSGFIMSVSVSFKQFS